MWCLSCPLLYRNSFCQLPRDLVCKNVVINCRVDAAINLQPIYFVFMCSAQLKHLLTAAQ